jgi:hypothetical protein
MMINVRFEIDGCDGRVQPTETTLCIALSAVVATSHLPSSFFLL